MSHFSASQYQPETAEMNSDQQNIGKIPLSLLPSFPFSLSPLPPSLFPSFYVSLLSFLSSLPFFLLSFFFLFYNSIFLDSITRYSKLNSTLQQFSCHILSSVGITDLCITSGSLEMYFSGTRCGVSGVGRLVGLERNEKLRAGHL